MGTRVRIVIKILEQIRRTLIQHMVDHQMTFASGYALDVDYEIVVISNDLFPRVGQDCDIYGYAMLQVCEWLPTHNGTQRAKDRIVRYVVVRMHDKQNRPFTLAAIIYIFLHELAHTVSIPEKHGAATTMGKGKNMVRLRPPVPAHERFVATQHSHDFYDNLKMILRIAHRLNIYVLPHRYRGTEVSPGPRYNACRWFAGTSPRYDSFVRSR